MKLLIADDDRTVHVMFNKPLHELGYEVLHAYDGKEALELVEAEKPDVVLLDVSMPIFDGRDICIALKGNKETEHIQVIMLTARDQQYERNLGFEVGADEYITKPCSVMYLERALKKLQRKRTEAGERAS